MCVCIHIYVCVYVIYYILCENICMYVYKKEGDSFYKFCSSGDS